MSSMTHDQVELLIVVFTEIKKQLTRIAEVEKINLWFLMETKATDRQKGIISDVLRKL